MFTGGPYFYNEYARQRHQELLEAAEKHRLLRQVIQSQENICIEQYRLYQKALLKLGEQMVRWGTTLQERYTRENKAPALTAYQGHGSSASK